MPETKTEVIANHHPVITNHHPVIANEVKQSPKSRGVFKRLPRAYGPRKDRTLLLAMV